MIPILMYHQVAEVPRELDPLGLAMPPEQFEQQMSYLSQNRFVCLTLPEAFRLVRNGNRPPAKSVVLTFDDGYQNNHSIACPILEKFGLTSTVFLVAGRIGAFSDWAEQDGPRAGQLLSWDQVRDLSRRGMTIGSHTLSHRCLTDLDDQSAFEEIRNSRLLLEDQLGIPIEFFSYPFSATSARIEKAVEMAGYTAACAGNIGRMNFFHLWRVPVVRNDTLQSFALKAGGWNHRLIVLRESRPGQLLRRIVRKVRGKPVFRDPYQMDVLNHDLRIEPKR